MRVAGLLLLVVAALLPASPATAQDIAIGVAAPMTGNLAHIGQQLAEGAQLAADEVNARGGIKGTARRDPGRGRPGAIRRPLRPSRGSLPSTTRSWPSSATTPPRPASRRCRSTRRRGSPRSRRPRRSPIPRREAASTCSGCSRRAPSYAQNLARYTVQDARQEERRGGLRTERLGRPDEGLIS